MMAEKTEKKFYQKWWFWLIVALLLIIYFSGGEDEEPTTMDDDTAETTEEATDETPIDEASEPELDDESGDEATDQQESNGVIRSGTYKVGTDIEPGEYRVVLNDDAPMGMGYLEVSSDSSHRFENIVTNENVESDTYITITEGQYLTISNVTIEN